MGFMLAARPRPTDALQALSARKAAIESEIEAQHSILQANQATFSTPLVDAEGFPRADLDVWAVRTARVRIIELRNDYKAVLEEIGKALEAVYARPEVKEGEGSVSVVEEETMQEEVPFLRVNGVQPDSPAAVAGLKREDLIFAFGSLTAASVSSLQSLATLVSTRENQEINVKILRSNEPKTLVVIPKKGITGRVTLGCHIVPYSPPS